MDKLNLPPISPRIRKLDGKLVIADGIRKKWVRLTPEEWVRQHFVGFLLQNGYPKSLISVEKQLIYNGLQKRSDILVFDRAGRPFLLVECKAPQIPVSEAVLAQAAAYNYTLQAPFLVLTNGLKHFFVRIDFERRQHEILPGLPDFPAN